VTENRKGREARSCAEGPAARVAGALAVRVAAVQRRLCGIYRLSLPLSAERFLLAPEEARERLPERGPRTGLLALEEGDTLWLGLYFHPRDAEDPAAILEETSHWIAVVWHAAQHRPVSPLLLELQAEVDRYAMARLSERADPLGHLRQLRLRPGLPPGEHERYRAAHAAAHRYCSGLQRRFPRRADVPEWLRELRGFYRRPPERKLSPVA